MAGLNCSLHSPLSTIHYPLLHPCPNFAIAIRPQEYNSARVTSGQQHAVRLFAAQHGLLKVVDHHDLAAGELLPAGGAALMVVWENTWANTLLGAIGRAGGEIIVSQRLAHADVLAALEA